jgi:hypothetical protein
MGKTSRRKGSGYERVIAHLLESIFQEQFRRTPLSGGWAKSKVAGDIVPISRPLNNFPFHFECKNRKALGIPAWLKQTTEECPANQLPVLAFHLPRDTNEYVCLKAADFMWLVKDFVAQSKNNPNGHSYRKEVEDFLSEHVKDGEA